jgi:opacity protein-like surface antigen
MYVEGYGGLSMPTGLDNPTQRVGNTQIHYSAPSMEQFGYLIGAKVGYLPVFWSDLKFIGFEFDVAYQQPTLKSQRLATTTSGVQGTAALSQTSFSATSALFDVYFQYPGDRFKPYVGAGVGVMYFNGPMPFANTDGMSTAFDMFAGLRYQVSDRISTLVEYKHMSSAIPMPSGGDNVRFASDNFLVGIAYHFNDGKNDGKKKRGSPPR